MNFEDNYEMNDQEPKLLEPLPYKILEEGNYADPEMRIWEPEKSVREKEEYQMFLASGHLYGQQIIPSQLVRPEQKCRSLCTYIMFFYRDNHFYMRTPSFVCSRELAPMLQVWLRPQYCAYKRALLLSAEKAKKIINNFKDSAGKASNRSDMQSKVEQYAIHSFRREEFASPLLMKKSFRHIFLSEPFETMDEVIVDLTRNPCKKVFLRNTKTDHTY